MKKNMKRVIASFMVLAVSVCFIPTFAFAADNDVTWNTDYASFAYGGQTYGSDNIKSKVTKEATCTEEGETTYEAYVPDTSSDANKVGEVKVPIAKLPHVKGSPENVNVVEPTCEKAGSHDVQYKCTECKQVIDEWTETGVVDPALGHEYTKDGEPNVVIENEKPATCKEAGSHEEVVKCVRCGKDQPDSRQFKEDPVDPDAHVYDAGTVTKEATCGEDGVKTFKCTLDATHPEKTEVIPATGKHDFVEKIEVIKEATYDEEGSAKRTVECSVCGLVKEGPETVVIPVKKCAEHKWDAGVVTKQPTDPNSCAETGEKTFTCTVCGEKKVETFGAKPHDLVTVAYSYPATCCEDGYTYKETYCKNCEYETSESVINEKANGEHEWVVEGPMITETTCLENGKADADNVYCDECGVAYKTVYPDAVYYEEPAVGHHDISDVVPETENIKAATCEAKGSCDKVYYCKVCHKEASRTTVETAALGHKWDDGVVTTPATCTAEGVKTFTCLNDKTHKKTEPIEKIEHTLGAADVTPATCVTPGKTTKTCSVCHEKVVVEETPALGIGAPGHAVQSEPVEEVLVAPTCTKEGEKVVKIVCEAGDVISFTRVAIPKAEHTWVDKEVKKAPVACASGNEGEPGIMVQECSVCHATQEVPISQHEELTAVPQSSYPAECERDGLKVEKCSRCNMEVETVLPKLGHDYEKTAADVHWDAQNPKKGYVEYTYTCKNDASHQYTEQVPYVWTKNPAEGEEVTFPYVVRTETTPATCEAAGAATYTLHDIVGDSVFTNVNPNKEVIDALGHNYVPEKRNVLDPTCEKAGGYDLVPVCDVCHKEDATKTQHVDVPALGHDWDEGKVTVEPTYFSDGEMTFTCKNDPTHTQKQVIPATTHTPGPAVIEMLTPEKGGPTCTKPGKGYRVIYCTCCYDKDGNFVHPKTQLSCEEIEVPATGHTPSQPTYNEDLDCTVIECLDCKEVLDIVLPEYFDEDKFSPEDAAAVEKAKADLIKLYNEEKGKDNPDTAALKVAQKALYEAAETAQDNVYKADLQIWFKDSANKTVKYNGKAVELAITDVTITEKTTGEVTFKYYSDLECTKELAAAPQNAGTYYALATVAADKAYRSKTTATPAKIVISKAAVKVTPASKTYKIKKAKALPKNKTFKLTTKGLNKKIGATYKKANKVGGSKIKVSKAGKVTVKKGLKKGTYKVKVKATPKSKNFAAKTVTIKIVIKK